MDLRKHLLLFLTCFLSATLVLAQRTDTLPNFTVVSKKGKVFLRWINPYPNVKQITIQRSIDASKKNFRSIISLPDPSAFENGYYDKTAPNDSFFYRIYVQVESINLYYTQIKQPVKDTSREEPATALPPIVYFDARKNEPKIEKPSTAVDAVKNMADPETKIIPVISENKEPEEEEAVVYLSERGTWTNLTDRRKKISLHPVKIRIAKLVRPKFAEPAYPSHFIYALKDGNILLDIPQAGKKRYSAAFYNDRTEMVFEIPEIKQDKLILDKMNFISSGWFYFKLYEEGKLKEINKIFIPKE
jgi:hypothetical protein